MILLVAAAFAGTTFAHNAGILHAFDTRTLEVTFLGNIPVAGGGLTYDRHRGVLVGDAIHYWTGMPIVFELNPYTLAVTDLGQPQNPYISGLGYDPVTRQVFGIGNLFSYGWFVEPAGTLVAPLPIHSFDGDWYEPGDFFLTRDDDFGHFYAISRDGTYVDLGDWRDPDVAPRFLTGSAYDADTKLFWFFSTGVDVPIIGLDVETLRVVALGPSIWSGGEGAAGWADETPFQQPELLLSGTCPGKMYVTVVDATPGGRVYVAAGTRAGQRVALGGPCAGTSSQIGDPRRKAALLAGANGVASTTFMADAGQCGVTLVQALDVTTCLPTSVRTARTTWP